MLQDKHQILSVGRSGHGKTLGILSWANHEETKPVHVLSLDRRTYLLGNTPGVTFDTFNARDSSLGRL